MAQKKSTKQLITLLSVASFIDGKLWDEVIELKDSQRNSQDLQYLEDYEKALVTNIENQLDSIIESAIEYKERLLLLRIE